MHICTSTESWFYNFKSQQRDSLVHQESIHAMIYCILKKYQIKLFFSQLFSFTY